MLAQQPPLKTVPWPSMHRRPSRGRARSEQAKLFVFLHLELGSPSQDKSSEETAARGAAPSPPGGEICKVRLTRQGNTCEVVSQSGLALMQTWGRLPSLCESSLCMLHAPCGCPLPPNNPCLAGISTRAAQVQAAGIGWCLGWGADFVVQIWSASLLATPAHADLTPYE